MLEAVAIIVTGGLAGWIAARLVRGAGYGLVVNVIVGIIGGVIGGKLFAVLQIPVGGWLVELGMAGARRGPAARPRQPAAATDGMTARATG